MNVRFTTSLLVIYKPEWNIPEFIKVLIFKTMKKSGKSVFYSLILIVIFTNTLGQLGEYDILQYVRLTLFNIVYSLVGLSR